MRLRPGDGKSRAGAVNRPVACAGQVVRAGDVIVTDDDGVVCVAGQDAAGVAGHAEQGTAHEDVSRHRLARGELTVDLLGLREVADRAGITYIDH